MKFAYKKASIVLVSLLTSVAAIHDSARAEDRVNPNGILKLSTPLECKASFVKEFTQMPVIKNSTNQTIAVGKVVYWQGYWAGKAASGAKHSITLSQPLAPGQTIDTGVKLSGDNNSCKAYY